jgi:hypothetical protein
VAFRPANLGASQLARDLAVLPVGALAYGSLFLLLGTLLSRPLVYGLIFAFGWESWVPNLPGTFQRVSVMSYLRVLAPHPHPSTGQSDLDALLAMLNPQTITEATAQRALAVIIIVALAAALYVFTKREYVPRDDVE